MKVVTRMVAQGDVVLMRVSGGVPDGARAVDHKIVTHSETGHHHIADGACALFEDRADPLICYLRMDHEEVVVKHLRGYDTHEPVTLKGQPGDVWQIRRQREWSPEGWRRVQD